jgi:hypothetical protein
MKGFKKSLKFFNKSKPQGQAVRLEGPLRVNACFLHEEATGQRAFMQGVVKGLMDLEKTREIPLSEAKKRLGLK